jgi:hypothetical protein
MIIPASGSKQLIQIIAISTFLAIRHDFVMYYFIYVPTLLEYFWYKSILKECVVFLRLRNNYLASTNSLLALLFKD